MLRWLDFCIGHEGPEEFQDGAEPGHPPLFCTDSEILQEKNQELLPHSKYNRKPIKRKAGPSAKRRRRPASGNSTFAVPDTQRCGIVSQPRIVPPTMP
jgi:hypothetical protein